jgi:hypothetical protein
VTRDAVAPCGVRVGGYKIATSNQATKDKKGILSMLDDVLIPPSQRPILDYWLSRAAPRALAAEGAAAAPAAAASSAAPVAAAAPAPAPAGAPKSGAGGVRGGVMAVAASLMLLAVLV